MNVRVTVLVVSPFQRQRVARPISLKFYVKKRKFSLNIFYLIVLAESTLLGNPYGGGNSSRQPRVGSASCDTCANGTLANVKSQRCSSCASTTPHLGNPPTTINCCSSTQIQDGICLNYVRSGSTTIPTPDFLNRFQVEQKKMFFF